jgi:hypothetical protein
MHEEPVHSTSSDEEARLLLFERQREVKQCASASLMKSVRALGTTPQNVVFSRNSRGIASCGRLSTLLAAGFDSVGRRLSACNDLSGSL